MIKTNKKINIANYSGKEKTILRKLLFNNISIAFDYAMEKVTINFTENQIIKENETYQVEIIDEDGNPTYNEEGEQGFETKTKDLTENPKRISKTLDFAIYNAIATQVIANIPSGLSQTEVGKHIAEMGIKLFIEQEGLYQGNLKVTDFE